MSGYTDAALERWAARIRAWADGGEVADAKLISTKRAVAKRSRDVYCYFDNDVKVRAPVDAHDLMRKLGLPVAVNAAVTGDVPESFVPESLDSLPYALPRQGTRWRFGSRAAIGKASTPRTRRGA